MLVKFPPTKGQTVIHPILQEIDDKTDVMADKAVDAVKRSVSSFWKYASGYATQMFTEDDLESEAIMVGDDNNPVLLDRLQAQLHALASDPETFLKDPDARFASASAHENETRFLHGEYWKRIMGRLCEILAVSACSRNAVQ